MVIKSIFDQVAGSLLLQTVIVGVVFGVTAYYLLRKRHKLPPGPFALPLIGNLLSIQNVPLYVKARDWAKLYGPVITVYMGPIRVIILNKIDVTMEALVKKQADFAGRTQTWAVKEFTEGGRSLVFGNYGPTWRLHRKLASKALRIYLTGTRLEEKVSMSVDKVIGLMKKENGPFDPHIYMSLITFNILCGVCFNEVREVNDPTFQRLISIFDQFNDFGNGLWEDIIPPLRRCPTNKYKKLRKNSDEVLTYIYEHINQHRETFSRDNMRDFTDSMLMAQKEAEDEEDPVMLSRITNAHVGQTINDIFGAGLDTSRMTLTWTLLYLAYHKDVQTKLHKEVDSVLDKNQTSSLTDRQKLAYTEAVLFESMRLSSVAPLGLPHKTMCDTTIDDYDIPEGETVMINHWALHHDPDQWEDVESFRPERFLDEAGNLAPKPYSWLPFSAGRRVCLGETVAKPELQMILASLMRTFEIDLPPGVTPDFEPKLASFSYSPKAYKIIVRERI